MDGRIKNAMDNPFFETWDTPFGMPTFANTVEAFERSGVLLQKVSGVFYNLSSSNTNKELQVIEMDMAPKFAAHNGALLKNQVFFYVWKKFM